MVTILSLICKHYNLFFINCNAGLKCKAPSVLSGYHILPLKARLHINIWYLEICAASLHFIQSY